MSTYERTKTYTRDLLGRGGRQFVLPWGAGRTVNTVEAARRLGVCRETVRQMCQSGEIQSWPIREVKGSPLRVSIDSLDNYLTRKLAKYDTHEADSKPPSGPPIARIPPRPPTK